MYDGVEERLQTFKPFPPLNARSTSQDQVRCPNPMPPTPVEKGSVSEISKPIKPFKLKGSLAVLQANQIICKCDQRSDSQKCSNPVRL